MLEQRLTVGAFIDFTPPATQIQYQRNGQFETVPTAGQQCYLDSAASGVYMIKPGTSTVKPGTSTEDANRNFLWLPWLPGAISQVPLAAVDVLTGPMSGCWLVTYTDNAVRYAAHLGTDVASDASTNVVNTTWNNFATQHAASVNGGFNPLRHWQGNLPGTQASDAGGPRIFGLYAANGSFHTVVGFQQNSNPTVLRIAGIQNTPTVAVARLQHVDQPGP